MHDVFLEELCAIPAPSGCEDYVRQYIIQKVSPHVDILEEDALGNLLVFKKGKVSCNKRLLLAAHMDEVGVIIKAVDEDGLLRFGFTGGIDPRSALGKRVLIGEGNKSGVIGIKAVHLTEDNNMRRIPQTEEMYIDIGASCRKEAEEYIRLGDYGVFDSRFEYFGNGFIKSRCLDDRLGCAAMIELICSEELAADTWFAFTVQEEVGLRGAFTAAYRIRPDICLILETTAAFDFPSVSERDSVCRLGGGVVIQYMDRNTIYDKVLFDTVMCTARENNVKFQTKTRVSGGNDAGAVQRTAEGCVCANISVPVRYIHTANSIASTCDYEQMKRLMHAFLENFRDIQGKF